MPPKHEITKTYQFNSFILCNLELWSFGGKKIFDFYRTTVIKNKTPGKIFQFCRVLISLPAKIIGQSNRMSEVL